MINYFRYTLNYEIPFKFKTLVFKLSVQTTFTKQNFHLKSSNETIYDVNSNYDNKIQLFTYDVC